MSNASFFDEARGSLRAALSEFVGKWAWFFAMGALLVVLGIIASGMAATTTVLSLVALGGILLIAGASLVVFSFLTGKWSGFLLMLAAGVLSIIAGINILSYPQSGAVAVTMLIGTVLLVAGIFRAIASITMRFPNWGWALASGIVTFVLGAMLLKNLQNASLWFLGLAIGIDLILHGISWMTFSYGVHRVAQGLGITGETRRAA
jgi:uncharacterized membrane protein HdeD (DUF308 family)